MKLYNSFSGKMEEFSKPVEEKVLVYVCGPTVYDFIHIGNARPIVVFDCFRRYLKYRGYDVCYVQNFTDLDDKIIDRANRQGLTAKELAEVYIKEYEKDALGLMVDDADFAPKVSENIDDIISFIGGLLQNGHAYEVDGDIFFDVASFPDYGKLSKNNLKSLEAGKKVEVGFKKKSPLDFSLWKKSKLGEPFWQAPWGNGRPGWHIECSVMAIKYLSETIDFHCGGRDLIFPHHENEIAQAEAATGKKFSNYWLHNGYINLDNRKMSKSVGNFLTVRDLSKKYGYEPIRYMLLQEHYRTPINYSENLLLQCKASISRIKNFERNILFYIEKAKSVEATDCCMKKVELYREKFVKALDYDFNTAAAIAVIFDFIRDINSNVLVKDDISKEDMVLIKDIFYEFISVLKLCRIGLEESDGVPSYVIELFERRKRARQEKKFSLADELRLEIGKFGYGVEETRTGESRLIKLK